MADLWFVGKTLKKRYDLLKRNVLSTLFLDLCHALNNVSNLHFAWRKLIIKKK